MNSILYVLQGNDAGSRQLLAQQLEDSFGFKGILLQEHKHKCANKLWGLMGDTPAAADDAFCKDTLQWFDLNVMQKYNKELLWQTAVCDTIRASNAAGHKYFIVPDLETESEQNELDAIIPPLALLVHIRIDNVLLTTLKEWDPTGPVSFNIQFLPSELGVISEQLYFLLMLIQSRLKGSS